MRMPILPYPGSVAMPSIPVEPGLSPLPAFDPYDAQIEAAQARRRGLIQGMGQMRGPQSPSAPIRPGQALALIGAALVAKIAGAKDRDVSGGLRGFLNTSSQMQNADVENQRMDFANRKEALGADIGLIGDEIQGLYRKSGNAREDAYRDSQLEQRQSERAEGTRQFNAELDLKDRSLQQKGTLGQQANTLNAAAGPYRAWSNPNLSAEDRNKAGALFTQITGQHPGQIDAESASWLLKESQAKQTDAKTEGIGLDNEFKRKSLPDRLQKVKNEVVNLAKRANLTDAQIKWLDTKSAFYNDEFALKKWDREIKAFNAETMAQRAIESGEDPTKAMTQQRLAIAELLSLNKAQLETASDGQKEALLSEQATLKAKMYDLLGGGDSTPSVFGDPGGFMGNIRERSGPGVGPQIQITRNGVPNAFDNSTIPNKKPGPTNQKKKQPVSKGVRIVGVTERK